MNLLIAILLLIGQTVCQPLTPEEEESIETLIEGVMSCRGIPGMSVAAVRGNEVVLEEGYGQANVETGQPVTSETLFGIGSISKQFTGILLSKIRAEEGYEATVTTLNQIFNKVNLNVCAKISKIYVNTLFQMELESPIEGNAW